MRKFSRRDIIFEDNHLIVVNKHSGSIVQSDITGDTPISEEIKSYIKKKYNKPGNVYLGIIHRLDRPTSGVMVFAKTSKCLNRLNVQFKERTVKKIYWAIVTKHPKINYGKLEHWLIKNQKQNKSYAYDSELTNSKKSILEFKTLKKLENYNLIEIKLDTGRHHQIRAQLSKINIIIKGDVKYGSKRPNNDGSIDLHSRKLSFSHPIDGTKLDFKSRLPKRQPWNSVLCD